MARFRAWLKAHWKLALGIGLGLLVGVYLYVRTRSNGSAAQTTVVPNTGASPVPDPGSGSGGASVPDITPVLAALQQQQAANQQQEQGFMAQIGQLFSQAQGALQQQAAQNQSQLQQALAAIQQAGSQQAAQLASINAAQGGLGTGATASNPSAVSAFAESIGIPVSWAQQYFDAGHTASDPITTLNAFLDSKGYRNPANGALNLVPAAVVAAGTAGGTKYQAGSQSASVSSPAGGGVWQGQTDAQIASLFQRTYGSDWQSVWTQQHAAQVKANGG